jgi:hypothetical protein
MRKYTLYAIGEIALVVIGILAALQINNWNEDRKMRQKEQKILLEIKDNLVQTIGIFQWQKEVKIPREIRMIDSIFHCMDTNTESDSLVFWMKFLSLPDNIEVTSSGFESLKSIGYDLIQSDTLRKEIIKLFDVHFPQTTGDVELYTEFFVDVYAPYYMVEYATRGTTNQIDETAVDNFAKMRQDRLFKNTLWNLRAFKKGPYTGGFIKWLERRCTEVIELIDVELDRWP